MEDKEVSFYDMTPEERGAIYDRAKRETGQEFLDLPPEERARIREER